MVRGKRGLYSTLIVSNTCIYRPATVRTFAASSSSRSNTRGQQFLLLYMVRQGILLPDPGRGIFSSLLAHHQQELFLSELRDKLIDITNLIRGMFLKERLDLILNRGTGWWWRSSGWRRHPRDTSRHRFRVHTTEPTTAAAESTAAGLRRLAAKALHLRREDI